jgi:Uma2 family endonuclease
MQQRVETPRLNYEDYCALPNDGKRYQIIDGELFVTPSPVTKHQRASWNLALIIGNYLEQNPVGVAFTAPFDIVLDDHTVVVPDLAYVSNENRARLTDKNIRGAPDLIAEILSPSTARMDRVLKLNRFAAHGVPHYWIIDPENETLEALVLDPPGYRVAAALGREAVFEPALFPGLQIPLTKLFK